MRPSGFCKLCLDNKLLAKSHLFPRAFYKSLKDPDGTRKSIIVTDDLTQVSNRQVSDYLLCDDCENKLKIGGEDHIINLCWKDQKSFPLLEVVKKYPGEVQQYLSFHRISNSSILCPAKIKYFVASILWRWAVHPWKVKGKNRWQLGPYEEEFRKLLNGEIHDVQGFEVIMHVLDNQPGQAITTPVQLTIDGRRASKFTIPGIKFTALTSKHINADLKSLSISSPDGVGVFVEDERQSPLDQSILRLIKNSRKANNMKGLSK